MPLLTVSSRAVFALLAALPLLAPVGEAAAQEAVWASVDGEARVKLPPLEAGGPLAGAHMVCSAQAWTLELDFAGASVPQDGAATIAVPRGSFQTQASATGSIVSIGVPHRALEPLMAGTRLTVTLPGGGELRFPLTGSRRSISAAAVLCSTRENVMADGVALTPYSSYLDLARALRRDDIEDFALSTAAQPRLRAAMIDDTDGRRLLLAELCGSSWYYGVTGCSLSGFVPVAGRPDDKPGGWRLAFELEGVFIRVDRASRHEGWPDLATVPLHEGSDETRWSWNGERYLPADAVAAGPQTQQSGG